MQGENLQQVRLNRPVIQADALASPGGRGPGRAEILHDPPIKKEAPFGRFFRFCCIYLLFKSTMHLAYKIVIKPGLYRYEIQPAQRTRSDRKDAKSVIHDTLGPLRPWSGTLSSSDRVPCALNSFITVRFSRMMVCQQIGSFLWRFYYFCDTACASLGDNLHLCIHPHGFFFTFATARLSQICITA